MSPEDHRLWEKVKATCTPDHAAMWFAGGLPDPLPKTYDLHGLTVHQAHSAVAEYLVAARAKGYKSVVVITGRSGAICGEFPAWCQNAPSVTSSTLLPSQGAYRVALKPY